MDIAAKVRRRIDLMSLGPVAKAVVGDRLTYLPAEKLRRIERVLHEVEAGGTAGDIVEFGVALGGSGIMLAHHAGGGRRFIGLDVFAMIPPPTSEKDDAKSKARYETISSGASKGLGGDTYYGYRDHLYDEVKQNFARHGVPVDGDRIQLHKGLFEETWPGLDVKAIAVAHVDCDWYDPVRYCLEAIGQKMSAGGAVIIDDYNDYGGCRTAVDEFVAARSDFAFEDGVNPFLRKL
jgi:asparagine synthase (glutamine-hydrolysing)